MAMVRPYVLALLLAAAQPAFSEFTGFLPAGKTTTCPYSAHRTNPLTSGEQHAFFEGPTASESFKSDFTVPYNAGQCQRNVPGYSLTTITGQVLVKGSNGLCTPCPQCKCTVWLPNPKGAYVQDCIGTVALRGPNAKFTIRVPPPGDEKKAKWGPDPDGHIHFQCKDPKSGALFYNKFYLNMPKNYCKKNGAQSMQVSQPNDSNVIKHNGKNEFAIICEENWTMKRPKDKCWALNNANPCPNFASPKNKPSGCNYNPREDGGGGSPSTDADDDCCSTRCWLSNKPVCPHKLCGTCKWDAKPCAGDKFECKRKPGKGFGLCKPSSWNWDTISVGKRSNMC